MTAGWITMHRHRRFLPLAAIVVVSGLTCTAALPASADVVAREVEAVALVPQAFAVGDVVIPPVLRDSFAISQYDQVQWPLPGSTPISDGYGYRSCGGCSTFHEGIDFTPGDGYPVQAVADGTVIESEYSGALGQHVIISHTVGGQTVLSIYGHLRAESNAVSTGDAVARGQVIGLVGSTGQSTGPHLHFGIQTDDGLIDPYPWLLAHVNT
jgi:murein DD-endopeptidase MepM/ murein hydrolase activator NlpD